VVEARLSRLQDGDVDPELSFEGCHLLRLGACSHLKSVICSAGGEGTLRKHDGPTAEALVRDVLAAAEDRTVLLITHRPEGLDLVDEVVRLDGCVGGEHARRPQGRAL
jgi:hypothetical protein